MRWGASPRGPARCPEEPSSTGPPCGSSRAPRPGWWTPCLPRRFVATGRGCAPRSAARAVPETGRTGAPVVAGRRQAAPRGWFIIRSGFDRLARGAAWNVAGKFVQLGVTMAPLVVVARLVGPEAWGIFALTWVSVGLVEIFATMAPIDTVVQRREIA